MGNALAPKQDRSVRTQAALIDALVQLLEDQPFSDITVSQIASQAGLTTGAIYRRFKDKSALLEAAFERFVEDSISLQASRETMIKGKTDAEKIEIMIRSTLRFTIPYLPLMRAASSLNDQGSFEKMRAARNTAADWWAGKLTTSSFDGEERKARARFAMRVVTAVFRDTLLAGPGADSKKTGYRGKAIDKMVAELAEMTCLYVGVSPK